MDELARGALARLSIDIANLTQQLAVFQSAGELMGRVLAEVDPRCWGRKMTPAEEGVEATYVVELPADQHQAVQALIELARSISPEIPAVE